MTTAIGVVCALACAAGSPEDRGAGRGETGGEGGSRNVSATAVQRTSETTPCRIAVRDAAVAALAERACRRAATGLEEVLARRAAPGVIIEQDASSGDVDAARRGGEVWALAISSEGALDSLELGGGARISAEGYLAHETAHRMATAMLFTDDDVAAAQPAYGSPLPDWLDEALGLLVEPASDQEARIDALFDGSMIYALPLRQFLYTAHPALHGARAGSPMRRIFYGQSLAFAQFVRERAGAEGLRTLVLTLREDAAQGEALTALPGLPGDAGALEQEWLTWLRARQTSPRAPP